MTLNKMKKTTLLWLSLISMVSLSAFAMQEDPFADLLKKLEEFTKKYPTEKVHLHLDKPYYSIGDDIWFKAYVVNGKTNEPSALSNILYVELINGRDSVQKQIKLAMKGGIAWGDFKLTDSLEEGNYRIRAYTQWMRNAGPSFFFDKTIKIGNGWTNKVFTKTSFKNNITTIVFADKNGAPYVNHQVNFDVMLNGKSTAKGMVMTSAAGEAKLTLPNTQKSGLIKATITFIDGNKITKQIPIKSTATDMDVQFFPEGGTLVDGLPSKVAVKVVNANGLGENISGKIIDNDGTEILDFETTYLGMGSFSLTSVPGKTYTAKVKFANGSTKSIALPKSQTSGYAISVNNIDSSKTTIRIMISPDLLNKGDLNLLAHHNGVVLFAAKVPTVKQIAVVTIQKSGFPSGIMSINLFSPDNLPVAERIAFVNNTNNKIELNMKGLKESYSKRENVVMDITATNADKPTQGSFSVSITNTSIINPDPENETNLLTSLLLTSDLKGYIEKPNHYFMNNELTTRIELDHLLLTQGWRKIDWKLTVPTLIYPIEKGIKISGTVTMAGKPVAKGKVGLLSSTAGLFAIDTLTDDDGKFTFDQIAFNDGTQFAIKATSATNKKNVKIVMDDLPGQVVTLNPNSADVEVNVNEALKNYLTQSTAYLDEQEKRGFLNRVNKLKAVEIVGEKPNKAPNSANLNGPGVADAIFDANDLKNSVTLTQFLNGRVAGLNVSNEGLPSNMRNGGNMSVFVDGVVFIDAGSEEAPSGSLNDLTLLDIESIEILKTIGTTTIYGHAGANGVIVITTKTGKGKGISNYAPGMLSYYPKGLFANRQFYSPKYDTNPDPKPDFRSTVYWNPHLVSDTNGKTNINFFNTDQAGTYRMVIEGIDGFGNLARKVLTYQVK
ncbi:TonB-dependent receptor plug domain-containing protein [Pedobacter sp. Du54]|uniref:TonB-dependent receptor plug domain-containing protein n=1 Tax=Pedobacter anseongensis TaxID=3133439 RepID=UPI003099BC90